MVDLCLSTLYYPYTYCIRIKSRYILCKCTSMSVINKYNIYNYYVVSMLSNQIHVKGSKDSKVSENTG